MVKELTAADFARGVKNPYFSKLMRKTEVAVEHEVYAIFNEAGEESGVSAEIIMGRCLADYAKMLKEHDDK